MCGENGENLIRNDPDKIKLSIYGAVSTGDSTHSAKRSQCEKLA